MPDESIRAAIDGGIPLEEQTALERELGFVRVAHTDKTQVLRPVAGRRDQLTNSEEDSFFAGPTAAPATQLRPQPLTPVFSPAAPPVPEVVRESSSDIPSERVQVTLADIDAGFSVVFQAVAITVDEEEGALGLIVPRREIDLKLKSERVYRISVDENVWDVVYVGGRVTFKDTLTLPFILPSSDADGK